MKPELNILAVEKMLADLTESEPFSSADSIDQLIDKMGIYSMSMSFVNSQMVIAKKILNSKKVDAYQTLIASSVSQEKYFAPSLAKDYISSKCANEQYAFDIAERTSRSLVHTIDAIRTAISALKEELKISNIPQPSYE